jgi:DNA excision repair protein ERCC-5
VVTDDSDIFLFGGTQVYRNVFQQQKHIESFNARDIERELSLTRERLVQLALLLGSDYTDGILGIGRVTAMEILSEWCDSGGLEAFAQWFRSVEAGQPPSEDESDTRRKLASMMDDDRHDQRCTEHRRVTNLSLSCSEHYARKRLLIRHFLIRES